MIITITCKKCGLWSRVVSLPSLDDWTGEDLPPACPACGGVIEARVTSMGAMR